MPATIKALKKNISQVGRVLFEFKVVELWLLTKITVILVKIS
jgi:hypothetical protein